MLQESVIHGIVADMEEINKGASEAAHGEELSHYEFAFHILPTVALEEVPGVFGDIKTLIDREGGHITHEEAPQNFDLAYTVVTHSEGKNYKYNHSYFGWMRFLLSPEKLAHLENEIKHEGRIMRFLLLRLTKTEIEQPFKIFEVKHKRKVEGDKVEGEKPEPSKPVSEAEIEKSLEGITA